MAVRFLPTAEERPQTHREDRQDLAEVIELRTKLVRLESPSDAPAERAVPAEPERPTSLEAAVKLLARRALSSGELRRALTDAEYSEIEAEEAVAECETSLYLDDTDLARSVTRKLRETKGESRARIRQKLRERYLPDAAIETALAELDDADEFALLKQTAEDRAKRMVGLERQVAERRLLGFLARRGWSGERATRAVREALDGSPAPRIGSSVRFQ